MAFTRIPRPGRVGVALGLITASSTLAHQAAAQVHSDSSRTVIAHHLTKTPRIDGRLDDPVWRTIPSRRDFVVFAPREGGTPDFPNEAWIGYDDDALYIAVRAHDPHPDSIIRRLGRRDSYESTNDLIVLFIDSWRDRRTGYQFYLSAGGVKLDALLSDDGNSDASWDGVWDGEVAVDSAGWSAEFAIPFRILRYVDREQPAFGIFVGRWVGRTGERSSIPQYRRSLAGLSSQMGTLTGMKPGRAGAVEMTPYVRAGSRSVVDGPSGRRMETRPGTGGDFKWLPRPSLSIDGTINPDFGQVEADPAVLNLTGTEVFQAEKRPFFLEGGGLLNVPLSPDGSDLLFYSRRIGKTPSLAAPGGPAGETTILGAARVTGRLTPALAVAALSAFTQQEYGENQLVVEPEAHYGVARLQQDLRNGRSSIGAMMTRIDRGLEDATAANLPQSAQAIHVSTQHQTENGDYLFAAWAVRSDLRGDQRAITARQRSLVHAWQRPDDGVPFDSLRTSMTGSSAYAAISKIGGGVTRFSLGYRRVDPGFDVNDMGFLNISGTQRLTASVGLKNGSAGRALGVSWRTAEVSLGFTGDWATHGERLPYARAISLTSTVLTPGLAQVSGSISTQLGGYCTITCTRGGPALLDPPRTTAILDIISDPRRNVVGHVNLEYDVDDGGRSHGYGATAEAMWRLRSNLDASLIAYAFDSKYDWFYYPPQRIEAAGDSLVPAVAALSLPVRSLTARANWTISTVMTLQWYGQAYVSRGTYSNVRAIAEPRAREWSDRFGAVPDPSGPGGIDYKQFRSNLVFRWEYRPGSALFVVWSQGRDIAGSEAGSPGLWPGTDLQELFSSRPDNVLALKMSYRLVR